MPTIRPTYYVADGRIAFYPGDASERCLVCGWRGASSWYVGQSDFLTDESLPERFPVCDLEHGRMWMRHVWMRALDES